MPRDYIPTPDSEFDQYAANFSSQMADQGLGLGFTNAEITEITDVTTTWAGAYTGSQAATAAARAATGAKDDARDDLESLIRSLARRLQVNPLVTDAIREQFRITVAKGTRTPVPPPTEVPLVRLEFGTAGRMRVHFGTDPGHENENTMPPGSVAVVVQAHLGGAPEKEEDWGWLANDSNSPYVHGYVDVKPTTWAYRVCYMNRKGEQGPWSATAIGTISAA